MRPYFFSLIATLCAGSAFSQDVFEPTGATLNKVRCPDVAARFAESPTAPSQLLCAANRSGGLRCAVVNSSTITAFCSNANAELPPALLARLTTLNKDLREGYSQPGGRKATQTNCPAGFPEGELLVPSGELGASRAILSSPISNGQLASDGYGDVPTGMTANFLAGAVTLPANSMRGRTWTLRGSASGAPIVCRFNILGGSEARQLVDKFGSLSKGDTAGHYEQAMFFRENQLWYEYWLAIDQIRQSGGTK